jgi:hypothetical protein
MIVSGLHSLETSLGSRGLIELVQQCTAVQLMDRDLLWIAVSLPLDEVFPDAP